MTESRQTHISDAHDELVHVLLCQELGGERIPDVKAHVMSRLSSSRRIVWRRIGVYAAAAAVLAVLGWQMVMYSYPEPELTGVFRVAGNGHDGRGATIITDDQEAGISLGGYCRVRLSPSSRVQIAGDKRKEVIRLERGAATCEVDRRVGSFSVHTEIGTVSVTGTKFSVRLDKAEGGEAMKSDMGKKMMTMTVAVMLGSVAVEYKGQHFELSAGTCQAFGAVGVKSEDPPKVRTPGKDGVANAVAKGRVIGVVQEKGEAWVRVKSLSGQSDRYIPEWQGGMPKDGGGPKKAIVKQIAKVRRGDKVAISWYVNDHLRIAEIEKLASGKGEADAEGGERDGVRTGEGRDAVQGFSGQVRGVVKLVGGDSFEFKVGRVLKTWKGNKADNPKALVGKTVVVGPRRANHEAGTGEPLARHLAFIRALRAGEEMTLELYNPRGDEFHILELNKEQRARAERAGEKK